LTVERNDGVLTDEGEDDEELTVEGNDGVLTDEEEDDDELTVEGNDGVLTDEEEDDDELTDEEEDDDNLNDADDLNDGFNLINVETVADSNDQYQIEPVARTSSEQRNKRQKNEEVEEDIVS
jgi:hypothetical protein